MSKGVLPPPFLAAAFLLVFFVAGVSAANETSVSASASVASVIVGYCGTLSTANAIYSLNQSVSAAGTCFTIGAANITLECNNFNVTYSVSAAGYAVVANARNNLTLNNCNFTQGGTSSSAYAVYVYGGSQYAVIKNSRVWTKGASAYGFYFNTVLRASASNVSGWTIGAAAYGQYLYNARNSSFNNVNWTTTYANALLMYSTVTNNVDYFNHSFLNCNAEGYPLNYTFRALNAVLTPSGTGQFVCAMCNNVTIQDALFLRDGVSFFNSTNSTLKNSTIFSSTGYPLVLYSWNQLVNVSNNTIYSTGNSRSVVTDYYSRQNEYSHDVMNSSGSSSYGFQLNDFRMAVFKNTRFSSSGSSGVGVYVSNYVQNVSFTNFNATTTGASAYALYLVPSIGAAYFSNLTFQQSNFVTTGTTAPAVYVYRGTNYLVFHNSKVDAVRVGVQDWYYRAVALVTDSVGTHYVVNQTVFNASETFWGANVSSNLFVQRQVDVHVQYLNTSNFVNANVTLRDVNTSLVFTVLSDASGNVFLRNATQEKRNATAVENYNNHALTVTYPDYNANVSIQNASRYLWLNITLANVTDVTPNISFINPTPFNGQIILVNYVFVNATADKATGTNVLNCTLNWRVGGVPDFTNYSTTQNASNAATVNCYRNMTGLAEGVYELQMTANNTLGVNGTTEIRTITVDLTNPTIEFIPPTPANETTINVDYQMIRVKASEALTGVWLQWNGTQFAMVEEAFNEWFYNATGLVNGNYSYFANGTNHGGRVGTSEERVLVVSLGSALPAFYDFVESPVNGSVYVNAVYAEFNVSTNISILNIDAIWFAFDGVNYSTVESDGFNHAINFSSLAQGDHYYEWWLNASDGNQYWSGLRHYYLSPYEARGGGSGGLALLNLSVNPKIVDASDELVFYGGSVLVDGIRFRGIKVKNTGSVDASVSYSFACLAEGDANCYARSCRVVEARDVSGASYSEYSLLRHGVELSLVVECESKSSYALFTVALNSSFGIPPRVSETILLRGESAATAVGLETALVSAKGFDFGGCAVGFGKEFEAACFSFVDFIQPFEVMEKRVTGLSWVAVAVIALFALALVFDSARRLLLIAGAFVAIVSLVAWWF